MNAVALNMNMFLFTGWNALFIFLWLRHRNV